MPLLSHHVHSVSKLTGTSDFQAEKNANIFEITSKVIKNRIFRDIFRIF